MGADATEDDDRSTNGALLAFAHSVAERCVAAGCPPWAYGGLVYLALTKDETVQLGDVDYLVPEAAFPDLLALFRADAELDVEETNYHSIKLRCGPLKVSFDSLDHYLTGVPIRVCAYLVNGRSFDGVDKTSLIEAYARGAATIPQKRTAYLAKLAALSVSS